MKFTPKEKMLTYSFKEYESKIEEIKKVCKHFKINFSEFVRQSNQRSLDTINKTID